MTMVEVTVVVLVFSVVLGAVLGMFDTLVRADQRGRVSVGNQEQVRIAMQQLARDVRGANPLLALDAATFSAANLGPQRVIRVRLGDTTQGQVSFVEWKYDQATGELRRRTGTPVLDAVGNQVFDGGIPKVTWVAEAAAKVELTGVTEPAPLFRYFVASGAELTTASNTSGDFANCTKRVKITLTANPEKAREPFTRTTEAQVRNLNNGVPTC